MRGALEYRTHLSIRAYGSFFRALVISNELFRLVRFFFLERLCVRGLMICFIAYLFWVGG